MNIVKEIKKKVNTSEFDSEESTPKPNLTTIATSTDTNPNTSKDTTDDLNQEFYNHYSSYYREYRLLIEYKLLPKSVPSGVYIIPSQDNLFVWHGVIFIRQHLYKGAIFKFTLQFPEDYPEAYPVVKFFTQVYHPQVSLDTGQLDISHQFPSWNSKKHYAVNVIMYIKKIFYEITVENALNKDAADLFVNNREAFLAHVRNCVGNSTQLCYNNPENSSLRFTEPKKEHERVLDQLFHGKPDTEEGNILSWVTTGVSKIFNIKY